MRRFPPILDFKEEFVLVSKICARLHNSQEMQHKIEDYLRNSKMITNQNTHKTQRAHDQKPQELYKFKIGGKEIAEDFSPMFKRKCHGTTNINAWVHVMTLGLINVARIGMHYIKT
jgi:hypothetical protein